MSGIKDRKFCEMREVNGIKERRCTKCEDWYTLDNYYSNCKTNAYWIDSVCKTCRKNKSLKRQSNKKEEILQKNRDKKIEIRGFQSPFNYLANKYLLLPQILPFIPKEINTFVDLFCGSTTVGINVNAQNIICNDIDANIIKFYNVCKENNSEYILKTIKDTIDQYKLDENNVDNFLKIRSDFNNGVIDWNIFYALVTYSFNQHPLYNKKGLYNSGWGKNKCHFNSILEKRIIEFIDRIQKLNINFINNDFKKIDLDNLKEGDFIYADPPYLISSKTYEWDLENEKTLLNILDLLNERKIKFALSNVLKHKKGLNDLLIQWSRKYKVHRMQRNYSRMSRGKEKDSFSTEVLVTNY